MVQNNLAPESQKWARELEQRLQTLERDSRELNEFRRVSAAQFKGVSDTVALLSKQQTILNLNTTSYTYAMPAWIGANPSYGDLITVPVPDYTKYSGFVNLTLTGLADNPGTGLLDVAFEVASGGLNLRATVQATTSGVQSTQGTAAIPLSAYPDGTMSLQGMTSVYDQPGTPVSYEGYLIITYTVKEI